MTKPVLLHRAEFKVRVFARDRHTCVFCTRPAVDAHHILERKLWPDGGYYLDNGASVCEEHHWACETTEISVEEVRRAAGIVEVCVPPGFEAVACYDKWGNLLREDGLREPGPLFSDTGARKALAAGGVLHCFIPKGALP